MYAVGPSGPVPCDEAVTGRSLTGFGEHVQLEGHMTSPQATTARVAGVTGIVSYQLIDASR